MLKTLEFSFSWKHYVLHKLNCFPNKFCLGIETDQMKKVLLPGQNSF